MAKQIIHIIIEDSGVAEKAAQHAFNLGLEIDEYIEEAIMNYNGKWDANEAFAEENHGD